MARSSYIYLVYTNGQEDPQAAFTVKWEAFEWMDKQPDPESYWIVRTPDGTDYKPSDVKK